MKYLIAKSEFIFPEEDYINRYLVNDVGQLVVHESSVVAQAIINTTPELVECNAFVYEDDESEEFTVEYALIFALTKEVSDDKIEP